MKITNLVRKYALVATGAMASAGTAVLAFSAGATAPANFDEASTQFLTGISGSALTLVVAVMTLVGGLIAVGFAYSLIKRRVAKKI